MKNKVCVHIVGTNGLPAKYGGFETLTSNLCRELSHSCDFTVYCSSLTQSEKLNTCLGARLVHIPLNANGWQSVLYDCLSLLIALFKADVILLLGSSGGFMMPVLRLLGKNVIVNVGGVDWQRQKWSPLTRKIIRVCEYLTVKNATRLVVDNEYIRKLYLEEYGEHSELIAYGGDHVNLSPDLGNLANVYTFLRSDYCLSVSRAQKDNNIHMLLEAFEEIRDINLVVISNWSASDYGRDLFARYANFSPNIILLDAIYDQKILDVIRFNARLYIHTHSACGTAPSLVEAMCLSLPAFCFDCDANRHTTRGLAQYFSSSEELKQLIGKYYRSNVLTRIASDLFAVSSNHYKWSVIAEHYLKLFKEFKSGA